MNIFPQVIEISEADQFSVNFLQKSGSKYSYGRKDDVGLVKAGPPDFFTWEVVKNYVMDHRGLFCFDM